MLAETDAEGDRTEYRITTDNNGTSIAAVRSETSGPKSDVMRYDASLRPVEARYSDGAKASSSYAGDGSSTLALTDPKGGTIHVSESANQRQRTVEFDAKHKIVGQYDSAGRLTALAENGRIVLRQEWNGLQS